MIFFALPVAWAYQGCMHACMHSCMHACMHSVGSVGIVGVRLVRSVSAVGLGSNFEVLVNIFGVNRVQVRNCEAALALVTLT